MAVKSGLAKCDAAERALFQALLRVGSSLDRAIASATAQSANKATDKRLSGVLHRTNSVIGSHCSGRMREHCCSGLAKMAANVSARMTFLRTTAERLSGEDRMRQGYFGGLGKLPWSPRKQRGPSCRRVWVKGHYR